LPNGELVRFGPESHHEILRETDAVRDRAMDAIDAFLAQVLDGA
jgi:lysophospholipase